MDTANNAQMRSMEAYIKKVFDDAFRAENRTPIGRFQFCILDNTVLLAFWAKYARVERRICYRLKENFEKNFGFEIDIKHREADNFGNRYHLRDGGPGEWLDVNHAVAECKMIGNTYWVVTYQDGPYVNPDFDASREESIIFKKLKGLHNEEPLTNYVGDGAWDRYCEDYEVLYGFKPKGQEKLLVSNEVKF